MFGEYKPWVLYVRWEKEGSLPQDQAISHVVKNLVVLDNFRKLNDRDILFQQKEIERLNLVVEHLEARINILEQKLLAANDNHTGEDIESD